MKKMNKTAAELYAEGRGITIKEASKRLARQLRESMSKKDDQINQVERKPEHIGELEWKFMKQEKEKKKNKFKERTEQRETASQIAAKKWIEEKRRENAENSDNTATVQVVAEESNKFEERTKQFFDAVDELFDELMARTMTIFEALGIVTEGDWSPPKGSEKDKAIRRMVKDVVRDIQNRVKDEYPNYKDLK